MKGGMRCKMRKRYIQKKYKKKIRNKRKKKLETLPANKTFELDKVK